MGDGFPNPFNPDAITIVKGDGVTDMTATIQGALNNAPGTLVVISGLVVVSGQITIPVHCGIAGNSTGPFDPADVTAAVPTLLIPNTSLTPIVFASRDAFIQDVMIEYPNQVAPTAATPITYPATISTPSGSAGCKIRRVSIPNGFVGLQLFGGRHLVQDCFLGCFSQPLIVDHSLDVTHLSHIQCNPFWNTIAGLAYPQTIDTYVGANQTVLQVKRADGLVIDDLFAFHGNIGMSLIDGTDAPAPSYGAGVDIRFDTFNHGIQAQSTQAPGWQIRNFSCGTAGATGNVEMLAGGGTAPKLKINGGSFWGTGKGMLNTAGGLTIEQVEGFSPPGSQTPPGVPGSTVALASPFPFPCLVTIATGAGVTVSAIGLGPGQPATGQTIAASSQVMVIVGPNQGIKLTYAGGTPTWTWFGL